MALRQAEGTALKREDFEIETRSHSTQFGINVPMLDLTHGAVVAGERMFVFGGESQPYYEWEECGLVVHVLEYGVPPLSTYEMRVSALAGGDFIFPDGHELVSAVYAVTFSHSLQQDVVLELQHCVDLQIEEDTDCLSFAVASPLPSPGSYTFSLVKGGRFSVRDRYGSIEASMSLCYCILMSEYGYGLDNRINAITLLLFQNQYFLALNKKRENSKKKPSDGTKHEQEECNNDYQSGKEDSDSSCGSGGEAGAAGSDGGSEESSSIDHSSDEKPESEENDDNTSEDEVESNESSEDKQDAKQKIQQSSENQAHVKPETSSEENIELESRPTFKDELKAERMSDQFSNTKVHLDPSVKSESLFSGHSSNTNKHQIINKLYYVCQTLVVKNPDRRWVAEAFFAKDLKVLTNYIERNSSGGMMQKKIVSFRLKKESLILDVLPMTKHGWNVVPFVKHPYEIHREKIDSFGRSKPPQPYSSTYTAYAESDAKEVLVYPLMITGVEETGLTLNIVIDGYDHVSPRMDSATALTERHELTDSTATPTSILNKKPSLKDACNMLRDHSRQWDDIGLQLDIPFDKRTEWHRDISLTNEQRLQRILIHWFEEGCHTPVTWGGLIEILRVILYSYS